MVKRIAADTDELQVGWSGAHIKKRLIQSTYSIDESPKALPQPVQTLKGGHSVRNLARGSLPRLWSTTVFMCVWYKTHADIGADGWANMSYLDHTPRKIIIACKYTHTHTHMSTCALTSTHA